MAYIGKEPIVGNFQVCDAISVVNGQAAYTMQVSSVNVVPESANHMLVSLNGILQKPNSSFTVSGSTITFASNLATGDVIDFIHILGSVLDLGVPSDDTVTAAKLATTAITGQTAETSIADDDLILISDTSASALRKMTKANFVSGVGGANTPAFFATSNGTGNQTLAAYTNVKVQFPTEAFDTDSAFDTSNHRFTPGVAGKYFFTMCLTIETFDADKYAFLYLYKNGSTISNAIKAHNNALANNGSIVFSFVDTANTTDYYEVYVYHNNGSTKNVQETTYFGAYKIIT